MSKCILEMQSVKKLRNLFVVQKICVCVVVAETTGRKIAEQERMSMVKSYMRAIAMMMNIHITTDVVFVSDLVELPRSLQPAIGVVTRVIIQRPAMQGGTLTGIYLINLLIYPPVLTVAAQESLWTHDVPLTAAVCTVFLLAGIKVVIDAPVTRLIIVDVDPSTPLAVPALFFLLFRHFVYWEWDR